MQLLIKEILNLSLKYLSLYYNINDILLLVYIIILFIIFINSYSFFRNLIPPFLANEIKWNDSFLNLCHI